MCAATAGGPSQSAPAPRQTPARVLVAEDDERVRAVICKALRRQDYEVIETDSGVTALHIATMDPPDLAIIQLGLPQISGLDVMHRLKRSAGAELPVLALGSSDAPEERMQAFEAGADDFISKPIYVPELLKRVDAFERTRRALHDAREANERAERLRLFSAEAAALLAHDLNNGLTVASATLEVIERHGQLARVEAEALSVLGQALRRMCGLVRNFVDVGRLEETEMVAARSHVDIAELFIDAAALHDAEVAGRDARVEIDCPPGLTAHIDAALVERMIHNVLGNAVRYVSKGGKIRLRARTDARPDDTHTALIIIEVSNTGPRLGSAQRAGLFEKYKKGGDNQALRGMGLYFCRLACQAHGGSIALEEDPEYDAHFAMRLPYKAS